MSEEGRRVITVKEIFVGVALFKSVLIPQRLPFKQNALDFSRILGSPERAACVEIWFAGKVKLFGATQLLCQIVYLFHQPFSLRYGLYFAAHLQEECAIFLHLSIQINNRRAFYFIALLYT
jgi:hypothetical protein